METCPKCQASERQVKGGHQRSGSQRYRCQKCGHKYMSNPLPHGYAEAVRQRALQLHVDGLSYHQVARHLHYLARLHHKSRCFSRRLKALTQALRLFVFADNQRQLYKLSYPLYSHHLLDFVSPRP